MFPDIFAACNCSMEGAFSNVCNNMTGYCNCRQYVTGKSCDRCEQNAFNFTRTGCMPCNCNSDGSTDLQCDPVSNSFSTVLFIKAERQGYDCTEEWDGVSGKLPEKESSEWSGYNLAASRGSSHFSCHSRTFKKRRQHRQRQSHKSMI